MSLPFLIATSLAALWNAASAAEPPLRVHADVAKPFAVDVRLNGPTGAMVWTCRVRGTMQMAGDGGAASSCPPVDGWYSGQGAYTFQARSRIGLRLLQLEQTVAVDGNEVSVEIGVKVRRARDPVTREEHGSYLLFPVEITRRMSTRTEFELVPRWQPTPSGRPAYSLVNHSDVAVYGQGAWTPLLGRIEKWENGSWHAYARGGVCATELQPGGISGGARGATFEGSFMGPVREFSPGRYRYVVTVTTQDPRSAWAEPAMSWDLTNEFSFEDGIPYPRSPP